MNMKNKLTSQLENKKLQMWNKKRSENIVDHEKQILDQQKICFNCKFHLKSRLSFWKPASTTQNAPLSEVSSLVVYYKYGRFQITIKIEPGQISRVII